MSRRFGESRFRSRSEVGEDVNPSAYIVNLADCMLVLACGFMVAMLAHWNIDLSRVEKVESDQLTEVAPETMPEDVTQGGSYYIEAGKVYQDPNTGIYYIVQDGGDPGETGAAAQSQPSAQPADATSGTSNKTSSSKSDGDISSARAAGAD